MLNDKQGSDCTKECKERDWCAEMMWFNAVEELGPGASSQVGSWYATCCIKETEGIKPDNSTWLGRHTARTVGS